MEKREKIGVFLILFLLCINIVSSATIVRVDEEQPAEKPSPFTSVKNFFTSKLFLWSLVIFIVFVGLAVLLFFLIRWLIKFFKERSDVFWLLKSDRIKFAKIHKRYEANHFWKVSKNPPVRLVKKENGKLIITNPIGYYRGDYVTNEGNHLIALNLKERNKFFFFPITDLLVIPNRKSMEIEQTDEKGKKTKIKVENIPTADSIIQFNENEVLIHADGVTQMGFFIIPVLKTREGKIVDLATPVYASLREVVIGDYLYEQTSEFTHIAKKSMDLNPYVRATIKTGDTNQSVEMPSTNQT